MRPIHQRILWLVVVPGLVFWLVTPAGMVLCGLPLDTSKAAADRVRECKTLAEAQRVIGGPPGDYCWTEGPHRFYCVSGTMWPEIVEWATPNGAIHLVAWRNVRDVASGGRTYGEPVYEVDWVPVNDPNAWTKVALTAIACFGLPWLFFLPRRQPDPTPAA